MQNKNLVVISLFIVIALFGCLIYFYKSMQKDTVSLPLDMAPSLVRDYSVSFGENRKNIIVVEFLDPECESCALFHPMVKKVFKEYHTDIKLVIKYLPNHKNSKFATKILEASREQHKYNEVLSMIFEKQPLWAAHNNEKPELLWTFLAQIEDTEEELYLLRKKLTQNLKGILPYVKILKLRKAEEDFNRKLLHQYRKKS